MTSLSMTPRCRFGMIALGVTSLILLSSVFVQTASAASTNGHASAEELEMLGLLKQLVQLEEGEEKEEIQSEQQPSSEKDTAACGVQSVRPNTKDISISRIVGGSEAVPNSWPWQVSIWFGSPQTGFGHGCGGSVLADNRFILTAAHCVVDQGIVTSPSSVMVFAGLHALNKFQEASVQRRRVTRVIPHPSYNTPRYDNDVALLQLEQPLQFNANVTPVCLASPFDEAPIGKMCMVTGWGTTSNGGYVSNVLNQVGVPIYNHATCQSNYGPTITTNMLCAGFSEGLKDSCQGDSGGPLVCPTSGGKWNLNGVVSFGGACAQPQAPGIYARVSKYINWMKGYGVNI